MTQFNSGICAISIFLSLSAAALDKETLQLKSTIHQEISISDSELKSLNGELEIYQRSRGDGARLAKVIRTSLENNCRGECLREAVRSMNMSLRQGDTSETAQNLVSESIKAVGPNLLGKTEIAQSDMLRKKIYQLLGMRAKLTTQDRDRPQDRVQQHIPSQRLNGTEKRAMKK